MLKQLFEDQNVEKGEWAARLKDIELRPCVVMSDTVLKWQKPGSQFEVHVSRLANGRNSKQMKNHFFDLALKKWHSKIFSLI